jgi:hypothetical protein
VNECFSVNLILPAALSPGVYLASNREKYQKQILDIFSGNLHIVYLDQEARFSLCSECYVDRRGFVSFHSPFFEPLLDCK